MWNGMSNVMNYILFFYFLRNKFFTTVSATLDKIKRGRKKSETAVYKYSSTELSVSEREGLVNIIDP